MSIQKKSLISTLQTVKKANVASAPLVEVDAEKHTEKRLGAGKLTPLHGAKLTLKRLGTMHTAKHHVQKG